MSTATAEYKPGDLVRTLSREGLWRVMTSYPGRVLACPAGEAWNRDGRWFNEAEIVRAEA